MILKTIKLGLQIMIIGRQKQIPHVCTLGETEERTVGGMRICKTNNIFVRPSLEFWCPPEQHIILTTMSSPELTEAEMEVVMAVFKSYETGLREATIYPKVE